MDDTYLMQTELPLITHRPFQHQDHNPYSRYAPYALHRPHVQSTYGYHHGTIVRQTTLPPKPISPPPPQGTHIGHLYPEILVMIFSHLNVRDRGRAAQVCTTWRDAAYSKCVWKGVEARMHVLKSGQSIYASLIRRGIKKIQILSLRKSNHLKNVVVGVPILESLNLSGCYNITDDSLGQTFITKFNNLKVLDLSLCKQITDISLGRIAQSLPNLETLELGGCCNIKDEGLLLIAWGLRKLKHLNLRSCWNISDYGISHLAGLSKQAIEANVQLKSLEYLGLQDCQRLSDEALGFIAEGLGSLNSINLSFCISITDSGLKHLARMPALEDLNLSSCDNITDIGIAYLTEGGSRISSLNVSFCDKISDQALVHISQGLYQLKALKMNHCQITDEGLARIAKSLQELEVLNIGQCSRVTDKGLQSLSEYLQNLNSIDLYGCPRLSEQGLDIIKRLPKLQETNLVLWLVR